MVGHWMIDGHTSPKPNVVYNLITLPPAVTSTTQSKGEKETKPSFDSRTSMSSYDAASLMSEKERAATSWRTGKEKKESKLLRFVTAIKKSEPSEPSPKKN